MTCAILTLYKYVNRRGCVTWHICDDSDHHKLHEVTVLCGRVYPAKVLYYSIKYGNGPEDGTRQICKRRLTAEYLLRGVHHGLQ